NSSAVASQIPNVILNSNDLKSQHASSSHSFCSLTTPDISTKIDELTPFSYGDASQSQKVGTKIPNAFTIGQKKTQPTQPA
ncbi:hypothetical protein DFH28DRAFT_892148, partial [Melampsora americana]